MGCTYMMWNLNWVVRCVAWYVVVAVTLACGLGKIAHAGDDADGIRLDFESFGAKGAISYDAKLPGSAPGAWCDAGQGFQLMSEDSVVGAAACDGAAGVGKVDWSPAPLQMRRKDGASFTLQSFVMLRPAPWNGQDYTWTVSGFDAASDGRKLFSQEFTTTKVPFVARLSEVNAAIAVKRIEFGGAKANLRFMDNGPSLLDDIVLNRRTGTSLAPSAPPVSSSPPIATGPVAATAVAKPKLVAQPGALVLICDTPGSLIRYTTDGSMPSRALGTIYTAPIPITGEISFCAIAYKDGLADSEVVKATIRLK